MKSHNDFVVEKNEKTYFPENKDEFAFADGGG